MSNVSFSLRNVLDITGNFIVKDYQRGYRWKTENVRLLLDDIYEHNSGNYCLQPVVVKKLEENTYELIDGQQRLTTLYILRSLLADVDRGREIRFSISYEMRPGSGKFLEKIRSTEWSDETQVATLGKEAEANIDFHFMFNTAKTIKEWFERTSKKVGCTERDVMDDFKYQLRKKVRPGETTKAVPDSGTFIIWYESDDEDSESLFRRLNVGKIPLTNAELIKALLLKDAQSDEIQARIAREWDEMTHVLMDDSFWYFVSNESPDKYSTRIDRLFELYTGIPAINQADRYALFFRFADMYKQAHDENKDVWEGIRHISYTLQNWYSDNALYDRIGYLVAIKPNLLRDLVLLSQAKRKSEFLDEIDKNIKKSVNLPDGGDYLSLTYTRTEDYKLIERLLLLFNVLSLMHPQDAALGESSAGRFDFMQYKKEHWSLEHIHAQQSQTLKNNNDRILWVKLNKESLDALIKADSFADPEEAKDLSLKMGDVLAAKDKSNPFEKVDFDTLWTGMFSLKPRMDAGDGEDDGELKDRLANMALLGHDINAAINNSTFDVKRSKIIEMDKKGMFIPQCTKNVFLKYYSSSGDSNLHFWGLKDQKEYVNEIGTVLKPYLAKEIRWNEQV